MNIYECLTVDEDGRKIRTVGYCTDLTAAEDIASKYSGDSGYWQVRLIDFHVLEQELEKDNDR